MCIRDRDRTVELVKKIATQDKRVRLISNQKNSGVSYTRKHGLDEARGSWIAILDSDDAWAPEKLERQIALQEKTNAELLFTGSAFMDADGQPIDWYLHACLLYTSSSGESIPSQPSAPFCPYLLQTA